MQVNGTSANSARPTPPTGHKTPLHGTPDSAEFPRQRTLAVLDLDDTLLDGDSDFAWTNFLIDRGYIDGPPYLARNAAFARDYRQGKLDINAYIAFISEPMRRLWPDALPGVQRSFVAHIHQHMLIPAAQKLIRAHARRGDFTMIMTATSHVIAGDICTSLGVDSWIATRLEMGRHGPTGALADTPCFRQGKLVLLHRWLTQRPQFCLENCYFYSDSHNDLPLLKAIGKPVAVNPDAVLHRHARQYKWPVLALHQLNKVEIPYARATV